MKLKKRSKRRQSKTPLKIFEPALSDATITTIGETIVDLVNEAFRSARKPAMGMHYVDEDGNTESVINYHALKKLPEERQEQVRRLFMNGFEPDLSEDAAKELGETIIKLVSDQLREGQGLALNIYFTDIDGNEVRLVDTAVIDKLPMALQERLHKQRIQASKEAEPVGNTENRAARTPRPKSMPILIADAKPEIPEL